MNKCGVKRRQPPTPEQPSLTCQRPAGWGTPHPGTGACKLHGGTSRNHIKRGELEMAKRQVALWGGRKDVHPAQALLDLVQHKASEVDYWRWRVAELAEDDLTWGVTKVKEGGNDGGITEEAKPHLALTMLRQAEQDLAMYCAACLKAGVDAALVQVAQQQASQLIFVIRRLLSDDRVAVVGSVDDLVTAALGDLEMVS